MIAYWFPPLKTVTLRSYYLYREWTKHFKKVTVITTYNRTKLPNEAAPVIEEDIETITTFDYRTVSSLLPSPKTHYSKTYRKQFSVRFFIRLLDSFPFNVLIGEGGFLYILFGYFKAVQLTKKQQPTYLYSSFRPYADHLIAWLLKKKFPHLFGLPILETYILTMILINYTRAGFNDGATEKSSIKQIWSPPFRKDWQNI
jgi:hypothetical protein